jgi:predicted Zn-dependent peptidase
MPARLLVFLLLVACLGTTPASAQQVEVEEFVLPNGMKFLLLPRHEQPNTITAGWVAKVGSVNERPGITGISHFFEHMMFKGTDTIGTRDPGRDKDFRERQNQVRDQMNALIWRKQYDRYFKGEIDDPWDAANDTEELAQLRSELKTLMEEQQGRANTSRIEEMRSQLGAVQDEDTRNRLELAIDEMKVEQEAMGTVIKDEFDQVYTRQGGSGMNAFTSNDVTFYFITVPSNKFELWAWMESDRLDDSVFREFWSERDVVHEERRLRTESTPTGIFQEQFQAMFWIASPYQWPVIGWSSDLNSYTYEDALDYWNTYYRPNNLVGVVVGDFQIDEIKPVIEEYFGRLEGSETKPPQVVTLEVPQMAPQRMAVTGDVQPQVDIWFQAVPFLHKDRYALEMVAEILNGRTGRLYKTMVEGEEIASTAGAGVDARKYGGAFTMSAEIKGDATPEQLEAALLTEVELLKEEPVSSRELQKVRNRVTADSFRRLQQNFFLLLQLGYFEGLGGWEEINEGPARLQAVTPEDIQRVARKYLNTDHSSVATYYRSEDAAPVDPEIAALDPQMQAMVKQALSQIESETDAASLQDGLRQMEAQASQAPPQFQPALKFLVKKVRERIAELEAGE